MSEHEDKLQEEKPASGNDSGDGQQPQAHTVNVHAGERAVAAGGNITDSQIFTGNISVFTTAASRSTPQSLLPLRPLLLTGRAQDIAELKARLGITTPNQQTVSPRITAVRGWVGVGKTSLVAALAHEPEIETAFPDGILWVTLGQTPDVLAELSVWGRALGSDRIMQARDVREASLLLAALLRDKRMLLFVDDVWDATHAEPFKAGGHGCGMVFTTRSETVAQTLVPDPSDVYRLNVLSPEFGYELLGSLAPGVVQERSQQCRELVEELGRLPLALQVAGRLLQAESRLGWSVDELLEELRRGKNLLESKAPSDRADIVLGTTPTIAVLLEKSTERLEPETRERFALLGVFAPEPSSFDLEALKAMWLTEDPKPTVRALVSRGLLEPAAGRERFQLHALLGLHARSMLTE
jgi:NB-ARC domain